MKYVFAPRQQTPKFAVCDSSELLFGDPEMVISKYVVSASADAPLLNEHAQGSVRQEQCSIGRTMMSIHRYKPYIHSIFCFDTVCLGGRVSRISGALTGTPTATPVHCSCSGTC